jgi:hypothetical protein
LSIFEDIANKVMSAKSRGKSEPLPQIQSASEQGIDEKKLAEFVRSKVDTARQTNSRIAIEGIYLTNVAYLMGFDGVYYDTTYRQFKNIDPKRKLTRNRFKVNKVLPTIQNRLARLTQSPPRYDVRPESNSTEDKDSARLGISLIEDILQKNRFDLTRQDLLMAAMQGGHSYAQVLWDPTLGKPMVDPDSGEFAGYEGDIRLEILNCLEVFPDPLAKTLDDCQWIVKAKVRKIDYFRERYKDRGAAVKEENAWLLSSIYDMKSNALTAVGIVGAQTQDQMKGSAIELVYYEKRSKDHPNGRMIVTASGVLLEDKELPIGEYDLVKFDDIMIGSRYNSEAVITHLRPIQDQYNMTRTKCAEWVRKMLAGKYIAPKGSGLSQEAINNDSGEVVEFNPVPNAAPPSPMQVPVIPAYVYKDLETLDAEFDFISGINEVSRGVMPSASIPAAGMAFLQEQDQTRIGVQTTRNEIGYAKLGSAILKYIGKYYEIPRVIKLAGDGLEYTVKDFVGKDLNENYDVIVVPGSTIPSSKVLKRQDLSNAYMMGLLGNPQDPEVRAHLLEMMEFGDTSDMWKKQSLDSAQVKRVIKAIEDNDDKLLTANMSEFDNQDWHLLKMNEYRLTDKFADLDDAQQQKFLWVMEWRLQAKISIANPQIPQQQVIAQQMVNNMHQQMGQPGGLAGGPAAGMNMQGNPNQPPMATPPIPQPNQNQ